MGEKNKKVKPRRAKGEGSIFQRKDKTWTAKIQLGVKRDGTPDTKFFYGKQRKDVVAKLDTFKSLHKTGVDESDSPYFDDYISNWLTQIKINDLKPTSYDRLEYTIDSHITPAIGHYRINEITDSLIQSECINNCTGKNDKPLSHSSIKKIYDALNACFKYAVASRRLMFNPMTTVKLPSKTKFATKEIEILTDDEVNRIIEVAKKQRTDSIRFISAWAFVLMIHTGVRMGEALALKWTDYNEEEKTIAVKKSVVVAKNRDGGENKYKLIEQNSVKTNNSGRVIPLSKTAELSLEELNRATKNYIISTRTGKIVKPRNFQSSFESYLKYCSISHKGIHITRHTFASLLFRRGADVKTVSELLGHADTRITENTYIHLIPKQKKDVISLLDN